MTTTVKLYNLKPGMWFRLQGHRLQFAKPHGMYAICYAEFGSMINVAMATDVEIEK